MTLADLPIGGRATVRAVGEGADGASGAVLAQRILQLGVLPGEVVEVVRRAPSGDPLEVRVLGYALSLRRSEARLVEVDAGA